MIADVITIAMTPMNRSILVELILIRAADAIPYMIRKFWPASASMLSIPIKPALSNCSTIRSKHNTGSIKIAKARGGFRELLIPDDRLKYLQRKIFILLSEIYKPRVPVHGFVVGRNSISNATQHQARPYLLNIDLKNFFGSISRSRIYGLLIALGLEDEVAEALCVMCTTRNQLPQGAPTSPVLANMVCFRLDREIMIFAKEHRIKYTRYADDISFSSYLKPQSLFKQEFPDNGRVALKLLSSELVNLIRGNGFEINNHKIYFSGPKFRKEVTGLVVNEFVNIKRSFIRNLRSSFYVCEKFGTDAQKMFAKKYGKEINLELYLRGRLEWIAQVRGRSFEPFRTILNVSIPFSLTHIYRLTQIIRK